MRRIMVVCIIMILLLPAAGVSAKGPSNTSTTYDRFALTDVDCELIAQEDANIKASTSRVDDYGHIPFWVDMVDADSVDNNGDGVYIAVLDTGLLSAWEDILEDADIDDDLGMGFSHDVKWDNKAGDFKWSDVEDDRGFITNKYGSGHGTHVTSTIVGYDWFGSFWIRGVAPKVTIIPVLVLDTWWVKCPDPDYYNEEWDTACHDGRVLFDGGTWEMVASGIEYVADLADDLDGPVIISMSLGGSEPDKKIKDAIDYAIDEGVIIVASAGNAGEEGMGWPGAYPDVISTGAVGWTEKWLSGPPGTYWWLGADVPEKLNTKDYWGNNWQLYLESFSSRPNSDLGQKSTHLDVVDPGAVIVGPYKVETYWSGTDWVHLTWGYYYLWGTSMAAPHVSGISSLVLEDYSSLDQGDMHKILKAGASGNPMPADGATVIEPWGGWHKVFYDWDGTDWGSGFLQADDALKAAKSLA
jgi:subtilisin family serine protease